METNRAKEIIIEILQKSLSGQLDPSSNFSPVNIADAIAQKIDFEKPFNDSSRDQFAAYMINKILDFQEDMTQEMQKLEDDNRLLTNYVKGKLTAYKEILDIIYKL
jgi:hypothetical protein